MTAADLRTDADFLRAVCAAPGDDFPRLLYADWLEEHARTEADRARAEFIRVQVEIAGTETPRCEQTGATLPSPGYYTKHCRCRGCRLRRREYLCSRRHLHCEWSAFFYAPMAEADVRRALASGTPGSLRVAPVEFRRGFVESVTLPAAAWVAHGPALVRAAPLRRVTLADREPVELSPSWRVEPWTFRVSDRPDARNAIPWSLFEAMGNREWFPSRDAALDALSAAALAWAKAQPA
jgi:uncharacterized protein (TIGR02996 family)